MFTDFNANEYLFADLVYKDNDEGYSKHQKPAVSGHCGVILSGGCAGEYIHTVSSFTIMSADTVGSFTIMPEEH